jgi:hypothetical protein
MAGRRKMPYPVATVPDSMTGQTDDARTAGVLTLLAAALTPGLVWVLALGSPVLARP